jgi:hypothetical protein
MEEIQLLLRRFENHRNVEVPKGMVQWFEKIDLLSF